MSTDTGAHGDTGSFRLPHSIELAWGTGERPRRGPKPGLTLERIVAAGIKVALTDGLGSVSMGRVAAELGGSTMSLYRYVPAKDDLLTLMVDTALGGAPGAHLPGDGWRAGLTRWAVAVRAAYRRHTWALRVPITAPPIGPNNVAWLDDALQCLAGSPLTEQQKLSAVLLISGFVRNEATLTADIAASNPNAPVMPGYGAVLSRLVGPDRFPGLQRAIASGALDDDDDLDAEFEFGLARILDGLGLLIASAGQSPPSAPAVS
ncbi:MAG: TetR/AcrR family transcriptional regulator [Actinomycetota bacterium]